MDADLESTLAAAIAGAAALVLRGGGDIPAAAGVAAAAAAAVEDEVVPGLRRKSGSTRAALLAEGMGVRAEAEAGNVLLTAATGALATAFGSAVLSNAMLALCWKKRWP